MSIVYVVKRTTITSGHVLGVMHTSEQGIKEARAAIARDNTQGVVYEVIEQRVGRCNRQKGHNGVPDERIVARVRRDRQTQVVEVDDIRAAERLNWMNE